VAFDTYSDLKTSIADILHRSDLTSKIPDFIKLCEASMNRILRTRTMETDNSLTLSDGARTVALPSGYEEPISLRLVITGEDREPLTQVLHTQLNINTESSSARRPEFWAINGANIEFPNLADQEYTLSFRMISSSWSLSDSTTTNWLLTNHPDLYFYGSLMHAAPHLGQDARISTWSSFYGKALREVEHNAARSKAGIALRTDVPSRSNGGYNINTDA
jgi:hypothetical protein